MDTEEVVGGQTFQDYWSMVVRRRWWIVLPGVALWAAALTLSFFLPAKYKSQTVILVEQPKVSTQYVTPNHTIDLQSRLQSLSDQILSRTRLLRIADELHVYGNIRSNPERLVARMQADTKVEMLASGGEVSGFKISYSASSPVVAQQVTGRLSSLFIEENIRSQQQLSEGTTNFLELELGEARKDLELQEAELRQFRSKYLGELPDQMQGNMQILSGYQGRLDSANQALNHAEQQKLYLTSLLEQHKNSGLVATGAGALIPVSIEQRIEQLKAQYADLSSRYTSRHPDLVRLGEQLEKEEKEKALSDQKHSRYSSAKSARGDSNGSVTSPPNMQLESQLQATELEIANHKKKIRELDQQIAIYQSRLNVIPARDQQLAALTRNYNQSRSNYESLLAKKLQSQIATNLEKRQQGEQFRILDPPSYPKKPYFPQPMYFAVGGLILGIVLGVGMAIALEVLNPLVYREEDIAHLGTVFGTVPPLPTSDELFASARTRKLEFAMGAVMAVMIPAATLLTYLKTR